MASTHALPASARRLVPTTALLWGAFATVVIVAVVATMQTGLHGDGRTTNPNPTPRAEPFLGVENWPVTSTLIFIGIVAVLVGAFIAMWRRDGRMPIAAIVFLAYPLMTVTDPIGNWVTFTVFDPRTPHFPMSWPWIRHAPLVEPITALLGGYPMYYLTVALGGFWLYRHVVEPRLAAGSLLERHPLASVFGFVLAFALVTDTIAQLLWMRADLYLYTQGFGPNVHWGGVTFPLIWAGYDAWMIAATAVLLQRDDTGRSLALTRLARRLPRHGRGEDASSGRQILAGSLFLVAAVLVPLAFHASLRVARVTHAVYDEYPYTETKVYDPYGDLAGEGKPGPFYR